MAKTQICCKVRAYFRNGTPFGNAPSPYKYTNDDKTEGIMVKYILQRLLYIVLVFFLLSFLLFMIYGMLPVDKAGEAARNEVKVNENYSYFVQIKKIENTVDDGSDALRKF